MTDNIPDWLKPHVLEERQTLVEGVNRKYLVISRKLEPKLPMFVSYNEGLSFISEDVPETYRPAWIAHEIIEFEQFRNPDGTWQPDHCRRALVREMDYVEKEDLKGYLPLRLNFFRGLVDYLVKTQKPEKFIAEVKKSRDGLEELMKRLER